ncbi:interleukin 15, like isoform X2 [Perca fluviatilis]|uniref:interleukin 15, like isoform X2 n=1 Tax=Perca fluviatilis TaxID=8168 RepID=UPI0019657A0C|nr:interleukin 15, like isoform X2 [Perca fluviatilis]
MLRGRLALASVYLFFVCLLGLMHQSAARACSPDTLTKVRNLITETPAMKEKLNCSLYTPTAQDYKTCPKSTLKCFTNETKVLIEEWVAINFGPISTLRKVHRNLQILSAKFNQPESECRQCEFLNEKNAEEFLEQLAVTLQTMNSEYC